MAYDAGDETAWVSQVGTSVLAINASGDGLTNPTVNYAGIDWVNADSAVAKAGVTDGTVTITAGFGTADDLKLYGGMGSGAFASNPDAFYSGALYNFQSLTISGLTDGQAYQLQVMNNDARGTDQRWTVMSDGTQSVADSVAAGTDGHVLMRTDPAGLAGAINGWFMADASGTLTLDIYGSRGPYTDLDSGSTCQFNALQLREVPEPATMALLGLGSLVSLRRRKK